MMKLSLLFLGLTLGFILPFYLSYDCSTPYYGYDFYPSFPVYSSLLLTVFREDKNNTYDINIYGTSVPPLLPCWLDTLQIEGISSFSLPSFTACYTNSSYLPCPPGLIPYTCHEEQNITLTMQESDIWITSHLYYYAKKDIELNYRFTSQGRVRDGKDITSFTLIVDLDLDGTPLSLNNNLDQPAYPLYRHSVNSFNISLEPVHLWMYTTQDYKLVHSLSSYPYSQEKQKLSLSFWSCLSLSLGLILSSVIYLYKK